MIDLAIDRLIYWLIDWFIDSLIDWLVSLFQGYEYFGYDPSTYFSTEPRELLESGYSAEDSYEEGGGGLALTHAGEGGGGEEMELEGDAELEIDLDTAGQMDRRVEAGVERRVERRDKDQILCK